MEFEVLSTDRLILRKLTPEVYDYIYKDLSEFDQIEFLGLNSVKELETERAKYDDGLWTYSKKFVNFQVILKENNKIIGWCGYHTWYTDHERAEIGYGLFEDDQKGKGFMSEALLNIIDFGFKHMKLHRIEAFVGPKNEASLKLMHKFNFVKEGHLREHYRNNNGIEDSIAFSLLKTEYQNN